MKRRSFIVGILGFFGLPILEKVKAFETEEKVLIDAVKISPTYNEDFTMEWWTSSCGVWQHVAHVYEGNKVHIYLDGHHVETIDSAIEAYGVIDRV